MSLSLLSDIHAVVPIKNPDRAKQRLAAVLDRHGREALFRAMAGDTLDALAQATRLDAVWIVTRDPEIIDAAFARGLGVIREPDNVGHTTAVARGIAYASDRGASAVLTMPADMPVVSGEDIDAVVRSHLRISASGPACTLVANADETGTNAVVMNPPDLMPLQFGQDSFIPHERCVREVLGLTPNRPMIDAFSLDIDNPIDLVAIECYFALEAPERRSGRTSRWLQSPAGIAAIAAARDLAAPL